MAQADPVTSPAPRPNRRTFWRPAFRARMLGFAAVLLIGATSVGLLVQRTVLHRRLDAEVSSALNQERGEMERLATGLNPTTGEPFGTDVAAIFDTFLSRNIPARDEAFLTFVDGEPHRSTSAPVRLDAVEDLARKWGSLDLGETGTVQTDAGPVRYLAVPLAADGTTHGVFVAVNFIEPEQKLIDDHLRVQGLVVAAVVTVALGVAWFTAGRMLAPLREVTETARNITETGLDQRISVDSDDEVGMLADTFNQMLDRLEATFRTQREFIDDAGHELRTPITVIMGQLELMGDDPEDRDRTLAVVNDELERMSRIVEDLLVLAKAEQPDFVRTEEVEINDFTTELAVKVRTFGDRDWKIDSTATGTALIDPQRVTQAVLNLARNASEHTGVGTEVALGTAIEGDELHLWVRDRGPGIAAEDQPRIFDRFARGAGDRRRSEGAGLGLAIVKAITEAHGGTVSLHSRLGRGTRFDLRFPGARTATFDATDPQGTTVVRSVTDPTTSSRTDPGTEADRDGEPDPHVDRSDPWPES